MSESTQKLTIVEVETTQLLPAQYNPRKWSAEKTKQLTDSIRSFGLVDPIIANSSKDRKNIVIGGHFRLKVAKALGYTTVPVAYVDVPDIEREKELNLRLNKNLGEWDLDLLAEFDETLLVDIGFDTTELDDIFTSNSKSSSEFNLQKELDKLNIENIDARPGDIYQLGESRLMVGDSTVAEDVVKLMNGEKADMCLTDLPYIADYKGGIRHGNPVTTKGPKRSRRYLETEEIPENFTELWMANIAQVANSDFSIIVYEAWKNVRAIWNEMEKHFIVKNMLVWHIPQKNDGYAAKHKFFNKYDIAMVGGKGSVEYNDEDEADGLQETYRTALFGISGKPYWEEYDGPNKLRPTDHIEFNTDDLKNSGQGIIFGTKPLDILIPYIKVLTKRGDLIVEPFSGSGSTLIAATRMNRRCYGMEKSPVYAEVIMRRWEEETGLKRQLVERALMTKSNQKTKDKLIALLEENPNLLRACKLAGVARATVYRWLKLDPEFAERVELAQEVGRDSMVDFAEAKLFENMKNNQQRALEYFLSHNSTRYANNAVQERHSTHRNVGRLAKLREGTDSVYLYPQTELAKSVTYYQKLNSQAEKLRELMSSVSPDKPLDIGAVDPILEALFLHFFPEMKERLEQQQMDYFNRQIQVEVDRRIALKNE